MKWVSAGVALALLSPLEAGAQEDELPDRFALNVGAFYILDSDTEFAAKSRTGVLGTSINFERDLSGDDSATAPRIRGYYRFNPHHRIDFSWYKIDRDGSRSVNREIRFGDATFPVNIGVESSVDMEIGKLAYTWSFYHVEKVELGLSIGAYIMSYEFALRNTSRTIVENKSINEPLPVFGLRMDYTINPRWHVLFDVETFYIELRDELRGSLDDLQLAVEYRPFRHVAFGASANRLAIDVKAEEHDYRGSVTDLYRGGQLYIGFRY